MYDETKYNAWANKSAAKVTAIKKTYSTFAFNHIPAVTVEFFEFSKSENIALNGHMNNFLVAFSELDIFDNCEELDDLRDHYLGFNDLTVGLANTSLLDGSGAGAAVASAAILHTRVADKITIDKLTGKEEDVPEWFNDFSRLAVGASWTSVICGQRVSQYLTDDALMVWKQMPADQNEFSAVKAHMIEQFKPLVDYMTQFCTRKQKNGESVLQFGLAVKHLAKEAGQHTNTVLMQRLFWEGLSFEIKKLVVSAKPTSLDDAIAEAREAEKLVDAPKASNELVFEVSSVKTGNRGDVSSSRSSGHGRESRQRFSSRHNSSNHSSRDRHFSLTAHQVPGDVRKHLAR